MIVQLSMTSLCFETNGKSLSNDEFELKFFKLSSMKGIKIFSITLMHPEKKPQRNPQKVGAVPWFPVALEKLWGEALSHWFVTAVGSVPDL